jgi:hypothetical protein
MLIYRYSDERHYDTLVRFWAHYGWLPCPKNALPSIGLVAETQDAIALAYIGMYMDPGRMGFIDWALRNPEIDKAITTPVLETLFKSLVKIAQVSGCAFIYSMTKNVSWGNKLISYGMKTAEVGATTYILPIAGNDVAFIQD